MLIVCPNCGTSYDVSAASLGEDGRSVRCVRCQQVWFATAAAEPAAGAAPMVSAAAATAQYQRGAETSDDVQWPDDTTSNSAAGDDNAFAVDPNLAARAADRSAVADDGSESPTAFDAPPLAPGTEAAAQDHVDAIGGRGPGEDVESVAARRARRARRELPQHDNRGRGPSIGMVIVLLLAVNIAIVGWRSDVVRSMPQTASLFAAIGLPVNLRGLALTEVTTTKEGRDGVPVLLVQGTITNLTKQSHDVPRLRFAMRNASGAEVYSWTTLPTRSILGPGDSEPFQTRLASPPADGRKVVVRFFNRNDAIGGIQ